MHKPLLPTIALCVLGLSIAVAAEQPVLNTATIPDDRNCISQPPPSRNSINDFADAIDKQFAQPIEYAFDIPRGIQKLTGNRKQAFNTDAFDLVPASSWYTPRHTANPLSLEELQLGPNRIDGPNTSGTWTIVRAKADGVTPGFAIEDQDGNRFFIKFDPPGYSELASGAEVVATKIFYAAGYFTPENYVVTFDPAILTMGEGVKLIDEKGRKRSMNDADLEDILERVEYLPDGRLRALASRYIPGKPIGPFRFEGTIEEDPNDFIPHQHRRELRGLYVLGSWLNHIDSKAQNSLDSYVTDENSCSYVRHYLIDFGTCLGSGGRGPHPGYRGHENEIDPGSIFRKIITLGMWVEEYEKPDTVLYPSIGRYSNQGFHPDRFHSIFPNPAYDNMTLRDAYWGARLVASFSDHELEAIVQTGQYSNPDAEAYLVQQLVNRRDIICKYWFEKMPPMDHFTLHEGEGGKYRLTFDDLAVTLGLEESVGTDYLVSIGNQTDAGHIPDGDILDSNEFDLPEEWLAAGGGWVSLRMRRPNKRNWTQAVHLFVEVDDRGRDAALTGLVRDE
ncbi:hypothetical protein KQI63_01905 [bacterium]|nr:hypothetical protein [bacterium]